MRPLERPRGPLAPKRSPGYLASHDPVRLLDNGPITFWIMGQPRNEPGFDTGGIFGPSPKGKDIKDTVVPVRGSQRSNGVTGHVADPQVY